MTPTQRIFALVASLATLLFLLLISVHFSTVISRLTQQVRRLTQELAILAAERDAAARQNEPRKT